MSLAISSTSFNSTDGLKITIDEFINHTNYTIKDELNKKYQATIRHYSNNYTVLLSFFNDCLLEEGFTVYSNQQRKEKHLGNYLAIKQCTSISDAELNIMNAIRKVANLTPSYIVSLNEIQNLTLQIKSNPKSDKVSTLLNIMQAQLDYLKTQFQILK